MSQRQCQRMSAKTFAPSSSELSFDRNSQVRGLRIYVELKQYTPAARKDNCHIPAIIVHMESSLPNELVSSLAYSPCLRTLTEIRLRHPVSRLHRDSPFIVKSWIRGLPLLNRLTEIFMFWVICLAAVVLELFPPHCQVINVSLSKRSRVDESYDGAHSPTSFCPIL